MRRRALILVALAASLGLAACGGGGDEQAATTDGIFDTSGLDEIETELLPPPDAEEPVEPAPTVSAPTQITVPEPGSPIGPQSPAEQVAELQAALVLLGYKVGAADGVYGKKTRDAVVKFQKKKKLGADGLVGPKTAKAINKELAKL